MKLKLTPPGTLLPALSRAAIGGLFIPVGNGAAQLGLHLAGLQGNESEIGFSALAFFVCGFVGLVFHPQPFLSRSRLTQLEASLPITRRTAVLERCVRTFLCLGVPVILGAGLQLAHWSTVFGNGLSALNRGITPLGLAVGVPLALTGHTAFVLLLFAYRPKRPKLGRFEFILVGTSSALAIGALLLFLPWHSLLVLAGVIVAAHSRVDGLTFPEPETLAIKSKRVQRAQAGPSSGSWMSWLGTTNRVLLRATVLRPRVAVSGIVTVALVGLLTAYQLSAYVLLPAALFSATALIPLMANALEGTDSLPISRGRVLPFLVGPSLCVVTLSLVLDSTFSRETRFSVGPARAQVSLEWDFLEEQVYLEVPTRLLLCSPPQQVRAPWGEVFQPVPFRFFGLPTQVHNPYGVGMANTIAFARWQVGRAAEAAGRSHSDEELKESILGIASAGYRPTELGSDLQLSEVDRSRFGSSFVEVPRLGWFRRVVNLRLVLYLLAWGIIAKLYLRSRKPRRGIGSLGQVQIFMQAIQGVSFLALITLVAESNKAGRDMIQVAEAWLDQMLGGSTLAWWSLCVTLVAALYYWILRGFRRTETPPLVGVGYGKSAPTPF